MQWTRQRLHSMPTAFRLFCSDDLKLNEIDERQEKENDERFARVVEFSAASDTISVWIFDGNNIG